MSKQPTHEINEGMMEGWQVQEMAEKPIFNFV